MSIDGQYLAYCTKLVRDHRYDRYISSLYLPRDICDTALVLYAFDVEISQIAALVSEPMMGELRLQWWRDVVIAKREPDGNPVAAALRAVISKDNLENQSLLSLLDARLFDLYNDPMADNSQFEGYLGETNSALFNLIIRANLDEENRAKLDKVIADACGHSGVFCGVVRLLQLLPVHESAKKSFFPSTLSDHQRRDVDISGGTKSVSQDWLEDIQIYALGHYCRAEEKIRLLPPPLRSAFLPLVAAKANLQLLVKTGILLRETPLEVSKLRIWWNIRRAAKNGISRLSI